jgi:hypothetical protein
MKPLGSVVSVPPKILRPPTIDTVVSLALPLDPMPAPLEAPPLSDDTDADGFAGEAPPVLEIVAPVPVIAPDDLPAPRIVAADPPPVVDVFCEAEIDPEAPPVAL